MGMAKQICQKQVNKAQRQVEPSRSYKAEDSAKIKQTSSS